MAAIGSQDQVEPNALRGFRKRARLITRGGSDQQQPHAIWIALSGVHLRLRKSPTLSAARVKFSSEFAMLNRRYPSPCAPNAVPLRQATPACSNSASSS